MRATPAVRFPELEVDALYDKPVMVYWPMDRTTRSVFYDVGPVRTASMASSRRESARRVVVASRQGPPLTEPPMYGEASPALEHLVLYDDGSSEWLTLKNEKVRYVQATRAAQLVGQVTASLSADDDMSWFAAPVAARVEILGFNAGSRAVARCCGSLGGRGRGAP